MIQTVSIIGAGNVAWHFSKEIKKAGIEVIQVFNRNEKNGKLLANELNCRYVDNLNKLEKADLYIFAVTDEAISELIDSNFFTEKNVVHTAGCVELEVFKGKALNYGVIYPLQTFTKEKEICFKDVPLYIEGNSSDFETEISEFAKRLSNNIKLIDSTTRMNIHLAAVIACNFSNYFYILAESVLKNRGLEFSILQNLLIETVQKTKSISPKDGQTGPARRNDLKTIQKHKELLKDEPEILNLYTIVTEGIKKEYGIY